MKHRWRLLTNSLRKGREGNPGQLLTFGGAMTSRLEWFFRSSRKEDELFNKPLAHKAVRLAVDYLFEKYCMGSNRENIFRSIYNLV